MNAPALSPWSLPALRQRWQPRLPGLLLVGLIAAASLYLAELPWLQAHGLSALTGEMADRMTRGIALQFEKKNPK